MSEDVCTGCDRNKTNAYKSTCVKRCVVKDDSTLDDTHIYAPSPPSNLYLSQSTWTCGEMPRGVGMATVGRFFRGGPSPQKSLSRLSNVCQKIQLHKHTYSRTLGRCLRQSAGGCPKRRLGTPALRHYTSAGGT